MQGPHSIRCDSDPPIEVFTSLLLRVATSIGTPEVSWQRCADALEVPEVPWQRRASFDKVPEVPWQRCADVLEVPEVRSQRGAVHTMRSKCFRKDRRFYYPREESESLFPVLFDRRATPSSVHKSGSLRDPTLHSTQFAIGGQSPPIPPRAK